MAYGMPHIVKPIACGMSPSKMEGRNAVAAYGKRSLIGRLSLKAAWEPRTLEIGPKVPKTTLHALVLECLDEINQLGTENAKLKNQITKLKGAK